jgi:mannosyltransferase OCH1-like enzyme
MTIPKVIYQSWKTKDLNEGMKNATDILKNLNPEYKYVLFDDEDCRKFLLDNYGINYLNAFDAIVPGAYKCDFWRYAVLYKEGGIYLDIDMISLKPFREFLKNTDRFVSVVDVKALTDLPCAIFQAFIAVEPGHPIMKYALEQCFYNLFY